MLLFLTYGAFVRFGFVAGFVFRGLGWCLVLPLVFGLGLVCFGVALGFIVWMVIWGFDLGRFVVLFVFWVFRLFVDLGLLMLTFWWVLL